MVLRGNAAGRVPRSQDRNCGSLCKTRRLRSNRLQTTRNYRHRQRKREGHHPNRQGQAHAKPNQTTCRSHGQKCGDCTRNNGDPLSGCLHRITPPGRSSFWCATYTRRGCLTELPPSSLSATMVVLVVVVGTAQRVWPVTVYLSSGGPTHIYP